MRKPIHPKILIRQADADPSLEMSLKIGGKKIQNLNVKWLGFLL